MSGKSLLSRCDIIHNLAGYHSCHEDAPSSFTKSLDSFDFLAIPALNKAMVLELARSEFLLRRENVLLLGNSGTGKTHIALRP
jgi:DNA replication protein DnaC